MIKYGITEDELLAAAAMIRALHDGGIWVLDQDYDLDKTLLSFSNKVKENQKTKRADRLWPDLTSAMAAQALETPD